MTESTLASVILAAATPPAASSAEVAAANPADLAAARAEGFAAGQADGAKTAVAAERARIAAIIDHESARGRESLARHFAFATDMSADAARAALAAAPAQASAALLEEMRAAGQPRIGIDGGVKPESSANGAAAWGDIAAELNARAGRGAA